VPKVCPPRDPARVAQLREHLLCKHAEPLHPFHSVYEELPPTSRISETRICHETPLWLPSVPGFRRRADGPERRAARLGFAVASAVSVACAALNQTNTVFPGTDLQMRYSVATCP